jgi:hypothetical protein
MSVRTSDAHRDAHGQRCDIPRRRLRQLSLAQEAKGDIDGAIASLERAERLHALRARTGETVRL